MEEGQEERRITKIAETSKEYKSAQELKASVQNAEEYAFGYDIAEYRAKMDSIPQSLRPKFEATQKRKLVGAREELTYMARNPRFAQYFVDFFFEGGFDFFSRAMKNAKNLVSPNFQEILTVKNLSNKKLEDMIIAHFAQYKIDLQQFRENVQGWQERFQQRVAGKIASGEYPIAEETLRRRLKNTKVVLGDALRIDLTQDFGGYFDSNRETAMIAQQEIRKSGEKVYTHEMFHALSGRTLTATKSNPSSDFFDHKGIKYNAQRVGLWFPKHFFWLNEAITESLTQELIQDESQGSYKQERELFQLLQVQGNSPVDRKLFLGVYFENYDPSLPYGERIPEWKKLYQAVNEAYTPGFLVKLDNFVKTHGITKGIEVIKNDWRNIVDKSVEKTPESI